MKIRFKKISLFGQRLILHERIASDVNDSNDFVKNEFGSKPINYIENEVLCIDVIQDALKANIENLKIYQWIKKKRLSRILSSNYLTEHLTSKKRMELFKLVIEDLEINQLTPNPDHKSSEGMSRVYQTCLVAMYSNCSYDEAEALPITQYRQRLDFAIALSAFSRGQAFDTLSTIDRRISDELLHKQKYPELWN